MNINLGVAILAIVNTLSAAMAGQMVSLSSTECQTRCNPNACLNVDTQNFCRSQCKQVIDISSCLKTKPKIKSLTDANTAANIKRDKAMNKLFEKYPSASYYFNSGNLQDKVANAPASIEDLASAKTVLSSLRGMCAQVINRYQQLRKRGTTLDQYKQILSAFDSTVAKIQNGQSNMKVKKKVGKAELLLKNCLQQGAGSIFQEKGRFGQKAKGFFRKIASPFSCRKCSAKCVSDMATYAKCKEKCPKIMTKKCLTAGKAGNPSMNQQYKNSFRTKQF